jgi:radical SAM superfamily enzyme YgiQ (UPF0313 family)
MHEGARLRRNPKLVARAIRPGTWGLLNPERSGALFVDRLGLTLLEAADALGTREAVLEMLTPTAAVPADALAALARERLDALERFGALASVPGAEGPEVLLVDPPCPDAMSGMPGPAKGLCFLAAVLEAAGGPRARILDLRSMSAQLGPERAAQAAYFTRYAARARPRVVGLTAVSATIDNARFLAALCKLMFPGVCVVVGGPHASYEWETLLRDEPAIDAVVLGEGEISFPRLVREVLAHPAPWSFEHVPGVAWRGDDATPRSSGWSPVVEDLDALPVPRDRDYLLNAGDYPIQGVHVLTARGCPFNCSFCSTATFTGRRIRRRGIERIVAEIAAEARAGILHFSFDDDIFTVDRARALALCQALRTAEFAGHITWGCNTRLDCLDEELIDALAAAGCRFILFGVESGDAEVQGRFGKGPRTLRRFREKIEHLSRAGIEAQLNFILGLPGEDHHTLGAVVELARDLPRTVTYAFNFLNIFPGTPLSQDRERLGLRYLSDDPRERFSLTAPTVSTPTLSAEDQIDAYLRLRWFCETGDDTLSARPATSAA